MVSTELKTSVLLKLLRLEEEERFIRLRLSPTRIVVPLLLLLDHVCGAHVVLISIEISTGQQTRYLCNWSVPTRDSWVIVVSSSVFGFRPPRSVT